MPDTLFVDTGFVLAYVNKKDQHHEAAVQMEHFFTGYPLLTTDAVLLEIGNALSRGHKTSAVQIIHHFQEASDVTLIHMNPVLFNEAFELYQSFADKEWGLVDCSSFLVMRDMKVTKALTFDHHFEQAGFQVLSAGKR